MKGLSNKLYDERLIVLVEKDVGLKLSLLALEEHCNVSDLVRSKVDNLISTMNEGLVKQLCNKHLHNKRISAITRYKIKQYLGLV